MTQEQKELLLKDLSARLPYGVKVQAFRRHSEEDPTIIGYPYTLDFTMMSIMFKDNIEEYKPYLFPLSSMTEEQKEELRLEHEKDVKTIANCLQKCSEGDTSLRGKNILHHAVDWCNKNHFDYRGLIPMGLGLDATGLNIY